MSMISPILKLDGLHVVHTRDVAPTKVKRFVAVDGSIVAELHDGRIWTNWDLFRKYCLAPGDWGGNQHKFLKCLVGLGIITRKEMKAHLDWNRLKIAERDKRQDQKDLQRLAKKYGFEAPDILKGK